MEIVLALVVLGLLGGLLYLVNFLVELVVFLIRALWAFVEFVMPSESEKALIQEVCTHSNPDMYIYAEDNSDVWCRYCGLRIKHVDPMSEKP